jgi:hypothetical protein
LNEPDTGNINALASLLNAKGLDASDFIDVINALANIKQRDAAKEDKEEVESKKPKTKFIKDKEYVYETRTDIFIYRSGETKSGRYYVWIYDAKTKRRFTQSLRTTNRIEALAKAEELYREHKDAIRRGVKLTSINTHELIRLYQAERLQTITDIPHQGITNSSFNTLVKHLTLWETYINEMGYKNRKLEDIPTETGKRFGIWMKEKPKARYAAKQERSNETINHTIAAIKKMYRDVAIDEKYITMGEFPIFRYLKVNRDPKPKRDILELEEFSELRKWMTNVWCREKDITDLERIKRYVYGLYLTIQYYGGFRNKEVLGIKWGDIKMIKKSSKMEERVNRSIYIPSWNSKTGVSRDCVAPVAYQFERIKEHYKKLGITEFGREDYVFINLTLTNRGKNIPYNQPAMEKRLSAVVEGSGLKKKLDATGRHITQYSARHYAAVDALMRNVSVYDVAMNLGTSVHYLEKTYTKQLTAMMKQKELTKGQGYWKAIEEREEGITKTEEELLDEGLLSKGRGIDKGKERQDLQDMGIMDKQFVFDKNTDDALGILEEEEYAAFKAGDVEAARAIGEMMDKIRDENS